MKNSETNSDNDENRTQSSSHDMCQPAESINSGSSSNSTTVLSSTNTNSTNLTQKTCQRHHDDDDDEEDEYTNWLKNKNLQDYSSSNSITHLPQFKQNFSVCIRNSNGSIKRPIVQYPFKTIETSGMTPNDFESYQKMQITYKALKVDYV
jgi:hypothetical protein